MRIVSEMCSFGNGRAPCEVLHLARCLLVGRRLMNKLSLRCVPFAALCAIGSATAADLPVKMPVKAPPIAVFSWTGCYVGGYIGGGLGGPAAVTHPSPNRLGAPRPDAPPPFTPHVCGPPA